MTATPPAAWISSTACSAVGQRRGTKAFAPGHQVLLEEGAEVAARAGRPGDVGAADRERVAGLAHGVLEVQVEALAAQLLDDLPGPGDALVLGALAGRRRSRRGRPSSRRCGGLRRTRGRTTSRSPGRSSIPSRSAASTASATPAIASWSVRASVVTPGLGGLLDHLRPARAGRRRRSSGDCSSMSIRETLDEPLADPPTYEE